MKRRHFLQLPLAGAALAVQAQNGSQAKGFKVEAGKDRAQEELNLMGSQFHCKVSSKDTNGNLLVYDTFRHEKGGPAYHFHHEQDEWFFVIKGEFIVKIGEDVFQLKAGDSAFAPRKTPHAFALTSDGEGHMVLLFQPAGTMEHFFHEMLKVGNEIPKNQETKLKQLYAGHGMQIVGPPLKV